MPVARVNGVAQAIKSNSNDFAKIIPGVTLTAKKAGAQQTITIDRDKDTLIKAVKDFVTEFNNTTDAVESARAKGQPNAFDGDLASIRDRVGDPPVAQRLRPRGSEPKAGTPEQFKERLAADVARWTKVIADAGIERI